MAVEFCIFFVITREKVPKRKNYNKNYKNNGDWIL